jgi:hypothetical protein
MKRITSSMANRTLAAVKKQWGEIADGDLGPKLIKDWDWDGKPIDYAIVWEEGPFEWSYLFPNGGRMSEWDISFTLPDVSAKVPAQVFAESVTSWSIGLYRED